MKKRAIVAAMVVLFFIWLLPLGIFIKPSQEKIACDGQRAICLCHAKMMMQAQSNVSGKPVLAHNTGSNKESVSHGGSNSLYLAYLNWDDINQKILRRFELRQQVPSLLLPSSIEHVPKL